MNFFSNLDVGSSLSFCLPETRLEMTLEILKGDDFLAFLEMFQRLQTTIIIDDSMVFH